MGFRSILGVENRGFAALILACHAAVAVGVFLFHFWSVDHLPPINDGSNCVARASTLSVLLRQGDFRDAFNELRFEKNNLLSIAWFAVASLVLGPGRAAFGIAWALALLAFAWANAALLRRVVRPAAVHLALLALAAGTPLFSRWSGLLSQRFDLFSVLLLATALSALVARRFPTAALLLLAAVLAKGAALPVAALCVGCYFLLHPGAVVECIRGFRARWAAWGVVVALGAFYLFHSVRTIVKYNLIGPDLKQSGMEQFLGALRSDPFYYLVELYRAAPLFPLLLAGGLALFLSRPKETHARLLLSGMLLILATVVLFTSHPVHTWVLVSWFIPGFWWVALGLASWIESKPPVRPAAFLLAAGLAAFTAAYLNRGHARTLPLLLPPYSYALPPHLESTWKGMREVTASLAACIEQTRGTNHHLRLVFNFRFFPHQNLHMNYDAFRVLLAEEMGRRLPRLLGWELATFSTNWKPELGVFAKHGHDFLFVLDRSGNPSHHFRGMTAELDRSVSGFLEREGGLEPLYLYPNEIPPFGFYRAYYVGNDKARELFPTQH